MAKFLDDSIKDIDSAQQALNNNTPFNTSNFKADGFAVPASYSADGNGLPYSKVPSNKEAQLKRNIISWFIPEFGIVRMYVNPASISYAHKKLITPERTKGGYTLQYWGEQLTTLTISGTTGSSGVEGINALYEIYRAEQFAFDSIGLNLAANNASADISNNLTQASAGLVTQALGNGVAGTLVGGVLGLNSPVNNITPKNIPTMAQLAFTVEMYYGGWVYRGFFESMTINERADNFLMEYNITFTATQKRGYRVNRFGWERSANDGPSQYATPNSFSGNVTTG
jgi:hypothetical protein